MEDVATPKIKLTIKHLTSKDFSVEIAQKATVLDLKKECEKQSEIAVASQKLIFRGKILSDDSKLDELKISDGCSLHMVQSRGNSLNHPAS